MTRQDPLTDQPGRQPLVSVIMNCYNGEKYLKEAIDSVLAQTYQNWEIIFWDNASTDSSGAIARSFVDGRLRCFRGDVNIPLGAARNAALAQARGEFVAFLDTDDIWFPAKLAEQVAYFERRPETDFAYTNLKHIGAGSKAKLFGRPRAFLVPQPTGRVFRRFLKRYPVYLLTVMIRHSALKQVGECFDPQLQVSADFDLFMRLVRDRQVGYLHRVLAAYRLHPGQDSRTKIGVYATEAEYVLQKLQRCFPESKEECKKEYEYFEAKISYYHARAALRQGDRAKARRLLQQFRWLDLRFGVLNLVLYMPEKAFFWLHELTGRYY
jgi:glycosyltransferase involved in cell wall biosynthesis